MPITATLLPEFDQEMATTRRVLERLPEDKFTWKPHVKSWDMRTLATHLANIPGWGKETIQLSELDIAPAGKPPEPPPPAASRKDLLELFDKNVTAGRAALAGATDEHLLQPWSLLAGGQTILTLPRTAVVRKFILSHLIHHRAQLAVYLRLNDVPVPSIYGPSADESIM